MFWLYFIPCLRKEPGSLQINRWISPAKFQVLRVRRQFCLTFVDLFGFAAGHFNRKNLGLLIEGSPSDNLSRLFNRYQWAADCRGGMQHYLNGFVSFHI
jgi:hypothetical protein